tara:strand:+ start:876 stop:1151 length:276 start_codon:yes stop_codon:yes gene_type:complete
MEFFQKKTIEVTEKREVFFFSIHSGNFSNYFDNTFSYQIIVLEGQLRIISNGEHDELFYLKNNFIEIPSGETFKMQNISCSGMKLLIVKYK